MFVIREDPEWYPGVPLSVAMSENHSQGGERSGHFPHCQQLRLCPGILPDCGGEGHQGGLLQLHGVAQPPGLQPRTLARPRTIPGPRVAPRSPGGGEGSQEVPTKQLERELYQTQ